MRSQPFPARRTVLRAAPAWLAAAAAAYTAILAACYLLGAAGVERHNVEAAGYWFAALGLLAVITGRATQADLDSDPDPCDGRSAAPRPGVVFAAFGISGFLYGSAITLGLLSDDFVLIQRAREGSAFAPGAWEYFRPLPLALWAALARFEGLAPPALHLFNLVQHAANGLLVFLLARRLGLGRATGFGAMALALTFPAAVESVAWPSGTFDLWVATAALVGALVVLRGGSLGARAGALAIAALAALLSKETAIVLPAVWWLAAWAGRRPARETTLTLLPALVLTAGFAAWRLQQGIPAEYAEPLTRYLAKEVLSRLFGAAFIPWSAAAVREVPLLVAAYVFGALALTCAALARARASPRIGRIFMAMLLWMVASVAPVYALFSISPDLQGSRYVYLASAGWALALALALEARPSWSAHRSGRRHGAVHERDHGAVLEPGDGAVLEPRHGAVLEPCHGAVLEPCHGAVLEPPLQEGWSPFRRGLAAVVAALVVAGSVGVRLHLADWAGAAAIRDRVLASADDVLAGSGCECSESSFAGLPDSNGGAYVFRNGFRAALGMARGDCGGEEPSIEGARCAFEWRGDDRFARSR